MHIFSISLKRFYAFSSLGLLSFFLVILGNSCKKEVEPNVLNTSCQPTINSISSVDTINPSDYFPAYPGSYWILVFNYNDYSDTLRIESTGWMNLTAYSPIVFDKCGVFDKKTGIIPQVPNNRMPKIWGDNLVLDLSSTEIYQSILLEVFNQPSFSKTYSINESQQIRVQTHYGSMSIDSTTYNDVLCFSFSRWKSGHYGWYPESTVQKFYFARDVGLIRYMNAYYNLPYPQYNLVDYYIAPH